MGKKYIIDLNPDCVEGEYLRIPARIAGEEQWLVTKAALTPYTEPDLEQVKADAYLKGLNDGQGVILESTQNNAFNNGYKKCLEDMEHDKGKENSIGYKIGYKKGYIDGLNRISDYEDKIRKEAYEKGLSDAWEAASEIAVIPYDEVEKIFGATGWHIFMKCTASEVIEKIKALDEKKQEEIKVGDEVVFGNDEEIKAVVIDEADEAGVWLLLSEKGCVERMDGVLFHRTGRHFSELTSIFEKMRKE